MFNKTIASADQGCFLNAKLKWLVFCLTVIPVPPVRRQVISKI